MARHRRRGRRCFAHLYTSLRRTRAVAVPTACERRRKCGGAGSGRSVLGADRALPPLVAMHTVYEALKLSTLSWPLVEPLGKLLTAVASLAGRQEFVSHYHEISALCPPTESPAPSCRRRSA